MEESSLSPCHFEPALENQRRRTDPGIHKSKNTIFMHHEVPGRFGANRLLHIYEGKHLCGQVVLVILRIQLILHINFLAISDV